MIPGLGEFNCYLGYILKATTTNKTKQNKKLANKKKLGCGYVYRNQVIDIPE